MSDRNVLSWFASRSLRLIGLFLVILSSAALIFLVLIDLLAGFTNPYLGILTYLILPIILVIGLLLVPLDSWLRRRRIAAGRPEYPSVDLNDPHVRNLAVFFAISGGLVLIILTVVTYKAVEFMDTVTFCGRVCHRVMDPEYTAYQRSPHASVGCVSCHIGPGAPWFVRSKLSGVPQVYHYVTNTYERPIPTPVAALRPSRDTCENCHWPAEFYGSTLRTVISYKQDHDNTQTIQTQLMRVGSGGVPGAGIHSHMTRDIRYLPANKDRSTIAWLGVKSGRSYTEYINPGTDVKPTKDRIKRGSRLMDCIDCHNRAAHDFVPFEQLLDTAITRQEIPRDLPFIKREAMNAVGDAGNEAVSEKNYQAVLKRIDAIDQFYNTSYPDIYRSRHAELLRVVSVVKRVYIATVFPGMKLGPGTYPNWRTHAGCFRCHGTMVPKGKGKPLSQDCSFCHSLPVEGQKL